MKKKACPGIEKYPGKYYSKIVTSLCDLKQYPSPPHSPPVSAKQSSFVMASAPTVVSRHGAGKFPRVVGGTAHSG